MQPKNILFTPQTRLFLSQRVLFGASSSLFLLGDTLKHHLEQQKNDWVADDLKDSMYVGIVISGDNGDKKAQHYYTLDNCLLRYWNTDVDKLGESLPPKSP